MSGSVSLTNFVRLSRIDCSSSANVCLSLFPVAISSITAAAQRIVSCAIEVSRSKENILKGAGNGSQCFTSSIDMSIQTSTGCSDSQTSPSTVTCIDKSPSRKNLLTNGISPERIVHFPDNSCLIFGTINGCLTNTFQTGFSPR